MTRPRVYVLYENSSDDDMAEFGPHVFFRTCVEDRLARPPWSLKRAIKGLPRKGVNNLIRTLELDYGKLRGGDAYVVAVIDADKVRERLSLPSEATLDDVKEEIRARVPTADHGLSICFLKDNMETLLRAIAEHLDRPWSGRKDRAERDRLCMKAAFADVSDRAAILDALPSARRIVDAIATAYERRPKSESA